MFLAGGLTQSNTMKLQGWVRGRRILVLIDSGASHNFISTRLVEEFDLEIRDTPPYKVCLEDGQKKVTLGCCVGLLLTLDGLELRETFYLFELGGVYVIL